MISCRRILAKLLRRVGKGLPARGALAVEYWAQRCEGGIPELVHLSELVLGRETAIDIGANVGIYSYRMSQIFRHVHAFEANPLVSGVLKKCAYNNVSVHDFGLSSGESDAILHVPVVGGLELYGWASLSRACELPVDRWISLEVKVKPLDALEIDHVSFIKIDVEGHELDVLNGAVNVLRSCRPVLLVEIRSENLVGVRELLRGLRYEEKALSQLTGVCGQAGNYLFLPQIT